MTPLGAGSRNGRVSVRPSVRLSVPSIAAAFRSVSAAGARAQQQRRGDSFIASGRNVGTCGLEYIIHVRRQRRGNSSSNDVTTVHAVDAHFTVASHSHCIARNAGYLHGRRGVEWKRIFLFSWTL